ncbi:MAG TPA: FAD-binding protein [Acidimicrobiia bacterium]|nr:FAD-binding protein [Acidimicrobiia bacterium]
MTTVPGSIPGTIRRMEVEVPSGPDTAIGLAPTSLEEVATILRFATEHRLKVQVWGGGSHQGYGRPETPDLVLLTSRLDAVEAWEPDDLTLTIGSGTPVARFEEMLGERNQTAVMPEYPGAATIGGVVSAGVSSLKRGRLLGTRERLLEVIMVTGDGRRVRAGGRVVKNVSGYDLSRLVVGAFGALGVLVSVCLKLWPVPPAKATVTDPVRVDLLSRPLAVTESDGVTRVFLWGIREDVEAGVAKLGGQVTPGHAWPTDPEGLFRWSLRVPPALTASAISQLPVSWRYLAIHNVGEVRLSSDDVAGAVELRAWAESNAGRLVVVDSPAGSLADFDPWGAAPVSLEIQRRLIAQFDPARVINPGRLPGGI